MPLIRITLALLAALALPAQAAREVYNFNPGWRLHAGDAQGGAATADTEVANQKIVDTDAGRGVLSIVEAEFYRLP